MQPQSGIGTRLSLYQERTDPCTAKTYRELGSGRDGSQRYSLPPLPPKAAIIVDVYKLRGINRQRGKPQTESLP